PTDEAGSKRALEPRAREPSGVWTATRVPRLDRSRAIRHLVQLRERRTLAGVGSVGGGDVVVAPIHRGRPARVSSNCGGWRAGFWLAGTRRRHLGPGAKAQSHSRG